MSQPARARPPARDPGMSALPPALPLVGPIAPVRLGLIVLQADVTLEPEFHRLMPPEAAVYVSRVPSDAQITPETLMRMKGHLARAASLLPPADLGALGYGCTSGSMAIGPAEVARLVSEGQPGVPVTDPFSAALAALHVLGLRRIALLTPYVAPVAAGIAAAFETAGVAVCGQTSYNEAREARVARIDPQATAAAARDLIRRTPGAQALFLSCTNLRTIGIIDPLEAELGLPVLSSNLVLAWRMLRLAGCAVSSGPGQLFRA